MSIRVLIATTAWTGATTLAMMKESRSHCSAHDAAVRKRNPIMIPPVIPTRVYKGSEEPAVSICTPQTFRAGHGNGSERSTALAISRSRCPRINSSDAHHRQKSFRLTSVCSNYPPDELGWLISSYHRTSLGHLVEFDLDSNSVWCW